jgi:hypothetical protein
MAARRGRRLAAATAAVAAAICIFGAPGLARAATAPPKGIQQVACRPSTFNVYYGLKGVKCYAGHGAKVVRIPDVYLVTTGSNRGSFTYSEGRGEGRIIFRPRERLEFPFTRHAELVTIDITGA